MSYRKQKIQKTTLRANTSYEGETIEQKVARITQNKEPIKDGAPLIYTDRKDGVKEAYDIRTDRFEIAIEAMDKVSKAQRAKREAKPKTIGEEANEGMGKEKDSGAEPIQTTDQK